MLDIIIRAGCFIAIIALGFTLRRFGVFQASDFRVLSTIVIKITLPCAIITSFAGRQIDPAMLSIALLGFGGGLIYVILGFLLNKTKDEKAFEMLNLSGYNIGNFTLPFVQSFLGSVGVITTSLFDTGNAFICLGGAFGAASAVKAGNGFDFGRIAKALAKSVPFLCYILVISLNLCSISLPGPIIEFAGIVANANAFLAMLMIGVGFHITANRTQIGQILRLLAVRYGVAAVLGMCFWNFLPFDAEVRRALAILVFSPIGSAVPPFTRELGGDVGLSSAVNSISIVISIIIIVMLLSVLL